MMYAVQKDHDDVLFFLSLSLLPLARKTELIEVNITKSSVVCFGMWSCKCRGYHRIFCGKRLRVSLGEDSDLVNEQQWLSYGIIINSGDRIVGLQKEESTSHVCLCFSSNFLMKSLKLYCKNARVV